MSVNGLRVIEGLERLVSQSFIPPFPYFHSAFYNLHSPIPQVNLVTLDLAQNRIKRIENVSHLVKMEEFWVSRAKPL